MKRPLLGGLCFETLPDDTTTRFSCREMWTRENKYGTYVALGMIHFKPSPIHTWLSGNKIEQEYQEDPIPILHV